MTPCSFFHSEPFKQLTCADEATLSALLVRAVCERWSNHLSRVFSCSWVRTLLTAQSCWTSATRRLWRRQSTTASSSATWTWSRWTTATYTTAMTSRDTSPSPWTSLALGEVIGKHSDWPLSTCFCLHLPQWGLKLRRTSAYLNAGYRLLYLPKSVCFCVFALISFVKYAEFEYAFCCLALRWPTVFVVTDNSLHLIWLNLIILWNPCLKPKLALNYTTVQCCQFLFGHTSVVLTRAHDTKCN